MLMKKQKPALLKAIKQNVPKQSQKTGHFFFTNQVKKI